MRKKCPKDRFGILHFAGRCLRKLGFEFFNHDLVCMHLDLAIGKSQNGKQRGTVCGLFSATEDDIEREPTDRLGWYWKEEAIDRVRNGYSMFVVRRDGRMISFVWIEQHHIRIGYIDCQFHIPEHTVYLTGLYTVPEFRKMGIGYRLESEVVDLLRKQGFHNVLCVVDPQNTTAQRLHKKIGFEPYQTLRYTRYWVLRIFKVRDCKGTREVRFTRLARTPNDLLKVFL